MKLNAIQITNLRNISLAKLNLHLHLNFITGNNGSGKTSFLEAVYLLASGHSFRSREISALVSHEQDSLVVFANTIDNQYISIQKSLRSPTMARINGQPCLTSSELAFFLPCQVIYQDIFQIIDAGPTVRRSLLDWGLFHVEHPYHTIWKDYRRALKQRNALLKQRATNTALIPWNKILSTLAEQLNNYRQNYFLKLVEAFKIILPQLTNVECLLNYYKGWDKRDEGKDLETILTASYDIDLARAQTHYGAHQADLTITSNDIKVKHFLSRGQQKMILFALKFAQTGLVNGSCIHLIDDFTSELDEEHLQRLLNYIVQSEDQFFITLRKGSKIIADFDFPHQILHMEQGKITNQIK
ncbi:DNA recombination and repair protein ATPase RecF [Legionella busanensis]|uniref:DNA replication and repair protein RecF n=1 Tax=Legionella busanensis TaxID=190655 RepID=A0A378JGI9_9GAMM|nr:DNA replication/repair protein RecF [Legionella busanensis]STX49941.1 DNA recombination and repair protein ATPase RecF [Legionella busanensis]